MADKTKRKALKELDNQRKDEVELERFKRQQQDEQNRLADQQAHGSLGDTVEDFGIQLGQDLGLSPNTTTDYVMGAKDAAVNLFSSNEAIVEYYKNYDANRAKEEQKVNAVYSRELSQEQAEENLELNEEKSKKKYKSDRKNIKNGDNNNTISAEQAAARYQKACMLDLPEALSGMLGDGYSID